MRFMRILGALDAGTERACRGCGARLLRALRALARDAGRPRRALRVVKMALGRSLFRVASRACQSTEPHLSR